MKIKHTPGPWRTQKLDGDGHYQIHITSGSDSFLQRIGTVHGHTFTANGQRALLARDEANACLIAAAPELLDLLERVVKANGVNHIPELKRECLAAIAKVTGENE